MEEYGIFGLFLATFASSTILPIPSEAVVATFIALKYNPYLILIVASVGNVLGSVTTYALGYFGLTKVLEKFSKIDNVKVRYFRQKSHQHGDLLSFFSFVPFFGDIFTLSLGLAKYNIYRCIFFIALGKTLRYAVIIFFADYVMKYIHWL